MAKRTTITIEDSLLDRVRAEAAKNRREVSAEICQLIDEALDQRDKKGKAAMREKASG